jgi:hypothetical protein
VDEKKSQQPQPDGAPGGKEPQAEGWIEKLAQKSAGLPEAPKAGPQKQADDDKKSSAWKYAGIGIQFAGTVGVMAYGGYAIDQWQGWKGNPALITGVVIGVIGGLYLLIKEAMKANK